MQIGFIGLGRMGQGMARNLLKAGHTLRVYNRTRDKAAALIGDGAAIAETPAQAAGGELLFTMLADDTALEAVLHGEHGAFAALRPGAVHVCTSTISPALSARLERAHAEAGHGFVAAPVFGRPEAAAAAKLFVVAGGAAALIERCRPALEAIGQRVFVAGGRAELASVVKLSGNFLIAAMLESLGEAFALVRKAGVDPQCYYDVITNSLFSAPAYKTYGAMIAQDRYEPVGFKLSLGLKDIRLALAAADAHSVPMPVASLLRDHLLGGVARGQGDGDWSLLARMCADNAGL